MSPLRIASTLLLSTLLSCCFPLSIRGESVQKLASGELSHRRLQVPLQSKDNSLANDELQNDLENASGKQFFSNLFQNIFRPNSNKCATTTACPTFNPCPTCPVCPTATLTTCGTGISKVVTGATSGSISFSPTASQTCEYRIIAATSTSRFTVTCPTLTGTFVTKALSSPGGTTQTLGPTAVTTSTGSQAIIEFITGVGAGPFTFFCTWSSVV